MWPGAYYWRVPQPAGWGAFVGKPGGVPFEASETPGADAPAAIEAEAAPKRRRRKMSAAAKARIAAGQRARWAKIKGTSHKAVTEVKTKRKVSAATKARLAAVARARWAKVKASGKSAL